MGDFRISVKVEVDLNGIAPLSQWLNYHPDRRDEILDGIGDYLDKAWAEARWQLDESWRKEQEAEKRRAKVRRVEILREQLAEAETEVEVDRMQRG